MSIIGKIRGINTRIRRKGISDYATQSLMFNADKIGKVTPSGYLTKSKAAIKDDLFTSLLENYEEEYKQQKYMGEDKFIYKEILEALLTQYITPSEYYQTMQGSSNAKIFADTIIEEIESYETFDDEDLEKSFIEWLKEDYRTKGEYSKNLFY